MIDLLNAFTDELEKISMAKKLTTSAGSNVVSSTLAKVPKPKFTNSVKSFKSTTSFGASTPSPSRSVSALPRSVKPQKPKKDLLNLG